MDGTSFYGSSTPSLCTADARLIHLAAGAPERRLNVRRVRCEMIHRIVSFYRLEPTSISTYSGTVTLLLWDGVVHFSQLTWSVIRSIPLS